MHLGRGNALLLFFECLVFLAQCGQGFALETGLHALEEAVDGPLRTAHARSRLQVGTLLELQIDQVALQDW